jgi:hypothetical protein
LIGSIQESPLTSSGDRINKEVEMVTTMEAKPQIKVEKLGFEVKDPTFNAGSVKTARATLTNPTAKQFTYDVEIYLGAGKAATSGVGSITIAAGASQSVDFTVTMPLTEATYPVYLDVSVAGELLEHYRATEDVVIEIAPAIEVGPITWV